MSRIAPVQGTTVLSGAAEIATLAWDADVSEPLAVRWFHAGTVPSRGKVRLVRQETSVSAQWLLALLAANGEDLSRYAAWVHSARYDGYVAVDDLVTLTPDAYENGRVLLVRLDPRPSAVAVAATAMQRGFFGRGIVRGKCWNWQLLEDA